MLYSWRLKPILHIEILAEVELAALGIIEQEVAVAAGQDFALMNKVGPIDDRQRVSDVVVRDEIDPAHGAHDLLYLRNIDRVDSGEGLVHQRNSGCVTRHRAISSRRRSPPLSVKPSALQGRSRDRKAGFRSILCVGGDSAASFATALMQTDSLRKTLGSCGR